MEEDDRFPFEWIVSRVSLRYNKTLTELKTLKWSEITWLFAAYQLEQEISQKVAEESHDGS